MKQFPWLLCVLLVVSTVSAQETSVPSTARGAEKAPEALLAPLVIEVRAQRISRSQLSEALLKELSQDPARSEGEKPEGALELSDAASDTVRLTYRDTLGRVTTRDLFLAPDDPEALEKITIAAANLVRDQTGALSQLEAAQRAEEEAALKAVENQPKVAPTPEPAVKPAEAPKAVYDPCHPPLTIPFGVDVAWMLGTSSTPTGRQAARHFSLGLAGTYSGGVHGFQISLFANVDRRGICGMEVSVVLNLSMGDVHGLQLAEVNVSSGHVYGAQLGLGNFAHKGVYGAQLGITNVSLGPVKAQLGIVNVAKDEAQLQLGVLNYTLGATQSQLGVVNVAWGDTGAQIGVLNVAKGYAKSQFGVINYAGSARAPLGLLNIVKNGHTSLDAWANENGALFGMITHGGDRIYNMYGVGTQVQKGSSRLAFALGIVGRLYCDSRFCLELQTLGEYYARLNPWQLRAQIARMRLAADVKLTDRISVVPAVGYAVMITDYAEEPVQAWFGESEFRRPHMDNNGKRHVGVYGFPSFGLGFRVLLSDPKKPRR